MSGLKWALPAVALLALLALFALQLSRPKDDLVHSAMIGKPVPEFALRAATPDRPGLSSADFADGTPKLMNVFASWCVPCIAEAPQLAALDRHGNPFVRIGADDRSEVQFKLGSSGVPETFVIDGKGVIRYQHIGDIRESDVSLLLEELRKAGA